MAENESESCLLMFIFGGMVGVALGLLFAPRLGKETRAILYNFLDEMKEKGKDTVSKTKDKAKDIYEEGKGILKEETEKLSSILESGKKFL